MKKTKENLLDDYMRAKSKLEDTSMSSEEYKMWLEEEDKVRNELVKLIQIESENKRDVTRNVIQVVTWGGSILVGIWALLVSFEFDKDSTLTSTNGRNIVTNFISKTLMFKK